MLIAPAAKPQGRVMNNLLVLSVKLLTTKRHTIIIEMTKGTIGIITDNR